MSTWIEFSLGTVFGLAWGFAIGWCWCEVIQSRLRDELTSTQEELVDERKVLAKVAAMTLKQRGLLFIDSLENHPDKWRFGLYVAYLGDLEIWIANRPYADLNLYSTGGRIGTWWQRRKIRALMDTIRIRRAMEVTT